MNEQNSFKGCALEKRIYDYKLKALQSRTPNCYIVEVNDQTVCRNKNNNLVLSNPDFPTEFTSVELSCIREKITGAEPKVYPVREWYDKQMRKLMPMARMMQFMGKEAHNG